MFGYRSLSVINNSLNVLSSVFEWIRQQADFSALFGGDWVERASLFDGKEQSLFWGPFLGCAVLLSAVIYLLGKKPTVQKKSIRGFWHFIFPVKIFAKNSSFVDVQVFIMLSILTKTTFFVAMLTFAISSGQSVGEFWLNSDEAGPANVTSFEAVLTVIIMVLTVDIIEYFVHRLHHKIPFLWAFHRVHHSAPTLNSLTTMRFHPFEIIIEQFLQNLGVGVVVVIATVLFGGVDFWLAFGTNVIFAALRLTYSHLRHTHVWINFPKPFCYILSSPAQHQIHHSRAERHIDKNFGDTFSLWDWMFGTLYNPKGRERFFFGLGPEHGVHRPRPHKSVLHVLVEPFVWIVRHYFPNNISPKQRLEKETEPERIIG